MLGLPALNADAEEDDDIFGLEKSRSRSTQFGLPALSRDDTSSHDSEEVSEPEWEDEEDYEATSIVPMSQLNEQMQFDANFDDSSDTGHFDPRATTAGTPAPSEDTGNSRPGSLTSAWGLDETSDDDPSTSVARGDVVPADLSGGFAQYKPPKDAEHEVGTLLGMTLDELEEKSKREKEDKESGRASRSTQFALPAAQREPQQPGRDEHPTPGPVDDARTAVADSDAISAITGRFESLEEESEDAPTQAWNPSDDPQFDEIIKQQSETKRKSKLERLRAKKHLLKSPDRDTAKGIPSPSKSDVDPSQGRPADPRKQVPRRAPDLTPHAQDDQRTSSISSQQLASLSNASTKDAQAADESPAMKNRGLETPASGVLKVPKRTNPPGSLRADDAGLSGTGSYSKLKSRGETTSDEMAVDKEVARVPATDGPVAGSIPRAANPPADGPSSFAPSTGASSQPGNTSTDVDPGAGAASPPPKTPHSPAGLDESSWQEDYAYAETGIAPADIVDVAQESTPPRPEQQSVDPRGSTVPPRSAADGPVIPPSRSGFQPASQKPEKPAPQSSQDDQRPPGAFSASDSQVKPFASSSTGPKFPISESDPSLDLPTGSTAGDAQRSAPPEQHNADGLRGASPTDLSSNFPGSGNMTPPGVAPPSSRPRGADSPPESAPSFDLPNTNQTNQGPPPGFGPGESNVTHQPAEVGPQDSSDGLTSFVGRAQSAFGILSGIVLLGSLYFTLQPLAIPSEVPEALALALVAISGLGGLILSLFPVSPGLRGVAFGILALFALGAFGIILTATAPNQIVLAMVLAGVGLAFVAALFPVIGKLVS